jgi:phosphohistidine phosphatase SixA
MGMAITLGSRWLHASAMLIGLVACFGASATLAQTLAGADLATALQGGGYVLVIRNAQSPEEVPAERDRAPANLHGEREINSHGQGQMAVIGYAFRQLEVPVTLTLTSPAYRSRQSGNYLGFGKQTVVAELAEDADASWLAQRVAEAPPPGQNIVVVGHGSLIGKALGHDAMDIGEAETLIYRPRNGGAERVARLTIQDWAKLAVN